MLPENIQLPPAVLTGATMVHQHPTLKLDIDLSVVAGTPLTAGFTEFSLDDGRRVFVVSELAENLGASVTNAWPELAEALLKLRPHAAPETTSFVEHYFSGSYHHGRSGDSFELVSVKWEEGRAIGHSWTPLVPCETV